MNRKSKYTTESIIELFKSVHHDKYDYSKVVYTGMNNKIEIRCIEHNLTFYQSPDTHKRGSGCRKCGAKKTQETSLIRYGTENVTQSEYFKKMSLDRYGTDHPSKSDAIKRKMEETSLEKYGVRNIMALPEIQTKIRDTFQKKYGVNNVSSLQHIRDKIVKTCLEKYGTANPLQNAKVLEKQQKSAFRKREYVFKNGDIVTYQGYENFALSKLEENGLTRTDILISTDKGYPKIYYDKNGRVARYFPDIVIPSENIIIEVKSEYTFLKDFDVNQKKMLASIDSGYEFQFWIFDSKGTEVKVIE